MDTIGKLITHLSGQMNDQQENRPFTRWLREDWMDYMNRGLTEIGAYRPDAFASTTNIQLVPGRVQRAPAGITVDSIGPVNDGITPVKGDSEAYTAFMAYAKCADKLVVKNGQIQYTLKGIVHDDTDPQIFYVSPPVPAGVKVTVEAKTAGKPPQYTLADWNKPVGIDSKYLNNLCTYMTACAYQKETESQIAQAQANNLFRLFYQTMGQKYKIDASFNSGYYKGETGSGDPRAMQ